MSRCIDGYFTVELFKIDTQDLKLMTQRQFINPYVEHGTKSELSKKITVSIPLKVLKVLTDERTRRQVNNLRHGTNSELLCEAFLHAFTGQTLPSDEELSKHKQDYVISRMETLEND